MNELQRKYFDALREHHIHLAASLNDPSLRGVREVISNLYRDDAHFIYELLQNADDQGATYTKFILSSDELIFIHNAPRFFSISDHTRHVEDKNNGQLGDVNSILSIASSSKAGDREEVRIGKFGLGFKSVFLFTESPEIYDNNIRFSITNYIVPNLIEADHPLRRDGETLFRFKFKSGEEAEAYKKISDKLKGLVNPILFLNSLEKIEWETEETAGYYSLKGIGKIGNGRKLHYKVISEESERELELWKFDKAIENTPQLKVSVVYPIEKGELTSSLHPLYCYLPTANSTQLPVMLHAPFRLTGNRESIMADDVHNQRMIELLGDLLVESLRQICDYGEGNKPIIKDNIIGFLSRQERHTIEETAVKLDISSLSNKICKALSEYKLLWCDQLGCYLTAREALVADNNYLADIYPSILLLELLGERRGWVLPSLTSELRKDKEFVRTLGIEQMTPEKILRRISPDFLKNRSIEWLKKWYTSLLKVPNLWGKESDSFLRYMPIILTTQGNVYVAPFIKGENTPNVYLSSNSTNVTNPEGFHFVHAELLEDAEVRHFFHRLGLTNVDAYTMAEKIYLPHVLSNRTPFEEGLKTFLQLVEIIENQLSSSQANSLAARCPLPIYYKKEWDFYPNDEIKLHSEDNDFFFFQNEKVLFFEPMLIPNLEEEERDLLIQFITRFPKATRPKFEFISQRINSLNEQRIPSAAQRPSQKWSDKEWIDEPIIEEFGFFITHAGSFDPKRASSLILRLFGDLEAYYWSKYRKSTYKEAIDPLFKEELRQAPWIELATPELRRWLGLAVKELQPEEFESVRDLLSASGIVSQKDVDSLLQFMDERGVLKDFQLKQGIEEQKTVVSAVNNFSLRWFKEVLNLRLKYVEAGEKKDIEFLITKLLYALDSLSLSEETDLRTALPNNINIIFGPPGTGKTTEITNIISSLIDSDPEHCCLILTPTNAAAKVVAQRLLNRGIEVYRGINPSNTDLYEELEDCDIPIYDAAQDRTPRILVTTVHYFTQTFCSKEGSYLYELSWDSIFIDETSMVTLDYVLFTLLKGGEMNPDCKFYLVGDPLQLPPVTNLDPFILEEAQLDEFNFYSFIGLSEFAPTIKDLPKEIEQKINIRLLTTQYRSIPQLCDITSRFAYNGKIKSGFNGKMLNLPESVNPIFRNPLSFVRFSISKDSDIREEIPITTLDKLKGSNYNIYSALLVKESLQQFFKSLHEEKFEAPLSIGIITPYTAQKKLIEKLLNINSISRDINIDLKVNTVHQFQGDEFDIVILVLNPPNSTMTPAHNILINKRYLINVATSRAKHSLIIFYPDQSCAERNFVHVNRGGEMNNIEQVAEKVLGCKIGSLTIHSRRLEEELFGKADSLTKICQVMEQEEVNLHSYVDSYIYRFVKGSNSIDILYSPKLD